VILLTSFVLVVLTAALYSTRFLSISLPGPIRWGLAAVRGIWFFLLVWLCLADPKIVRHENTVLDPILPIVIDDSASMSLPVSLETPGSGDAVRSKWDLVRSLVQREGLADRIQSRRLEPRIIHLSGLFSAQIQLNQDFPESPELPDTNLAGALHTLSLQYTSERCPGFLFLTDGQWNAGGDPLLASVPVGATSSFRVYIIGIGDQSSPTDVCLTTISAPPSLRSGRMAELTVYGDAEGVQARTTGRLKTSLQKAGGEIVWATESEISFDPGTARWRRIVQFPATEAGMFQVTAEIATDGPDRNPSNNRISSDIQILEDVDRVLLLTSGPDWDSKLILRSLESDPFTETEAYLFHQGGFLRLGDRLWVQQAEKTAEPSESRLPPPTEDPLQRAGRWSVVVLHGLPLDGPQEPLHDWIVEYVENGGALVVLPGGRGRDPHVYWPCNPSGTQVSVVDGDLSAVPVPTGTGSALAESLVPMLQGDLPPLRRVFVVTPQPPGSQVLVGSLGGSNPPVMAAMRHGLGRVVHVYSDSFWRWRMFGSLEQGDAFGRFWRGLVHLLSPSSVPAVGRLLVSDLSPFVGQVVEIRLEMSPDSPVQPENSLVAVDGPDGRGMLPLVRDPENPLRATAEYVPGASGAYRVREEQLGYEANFDAVYPAEETLRPAQNVAFLTALAESTGGVYRDVEQWGEVVNAIPYHPLTFDREQQRFWASRFGALMCLIGIIVAEWYFRQRQGLP